MLYKIICFRLFAIILIASTFFLLADNVYSQNKVKDLKVQYKKAKSALKEKNLPEAINIFENILYKYKLNANNKTNIIKKLKQACFDIGFEFMNKGHHDKAASSFEKGVKWGEEIEKDSLYYSLKFGVGKSLYSQNFFDDAIEIFKEIKDVKEAKENMDARIYIGVCYYSQEKYDDMIYWLSRMINEVDDGHYKMEMSLYLAIAYIKTAKNKEALEILEMICSSPHTSITTKKQALGWLEKVKRELKNSNLDGKTRTDHFEISFEGNRESSVLNDLKDIVEDAYDDVGRMLDYYPEYRIIVYVYSPKNFHASSATMAWAGACYDNGRLKLPLSYVTGSLTVVKENIYHEYTHLLVDMKAKGASKIPLWFNEGCAVNCSNGIKRNYTEIMKLMIKSGKPTDLNLVSQYFRSANIGIALGGYAYSAYVVKYIIEEKGERALSEILEWVGNGESFNEGFYNVFFMDLEKFNNEFVDWVKSHL